MNAIGANGEGACADLGQRDGECTVMADQPLESVDSGKGQPKVVGLTGLASMPENTLLDETMLSGLLEVSTRTLRRMVGRRQLPQGMKMGCRRIWLAGKVIEFLSDEADRQIAKAKMMATRMSKLEV